MHRAISIFKIQFAGAVMRGPFPDLHTAISIFKIQFAVVASWPCLACQVVFERKGLAREMVSNFNVGATTYTVCWVGTDRGAGHASPVKWCLNEKVELLCKLAMPRLSSGV